jgi:hypothetical protein
MVRSVDGFLAETKIVLTSPILEESLINSLIPIDAQHMPRRFESKQQQNNHILNDP